MPKTNVIVRMVGEDGNAFAIIGRVRAALNRGGHQDLVEEFTKEATSGNYDHLLQTVMKYVEIDDLDDEDYISVGDDE